MKKEYEVPHMDIVKFNMDTDIMTESANINTDEYNKMPGANSL